MTRKKKQKAVAMMVTGMVVASNISHIYADTKTELTGTEKLIKHDTTAKNVLATNITKTKESDVLKGGIKEIFATGSKTGYAESSISDFPDNGTILSGVYDGFNRTWTFDKNKKYMKSRIETTCENRQVISCSSITQNGDILYGFLNEHKVMRVINSTRFIQKDLDLFSEKYKGDYFRGEDGIRNIKELKDGNIVVVTASSISIVDKNLNKLKEVTFQDLGFSDLDRERVHDGSDIIIDDKGIILPFWDGILKLDFNLEQIWFESMNVETLSYREGSKNFFITDKDTIKAYDFDCKLQSEVKIPTNLKYNGNDNRYKKISSIQPIDENLVISAVSDIKTSIITLSVVDVRNGKILDTLKKDLKEIDRYVPPKYSDDDVLNMKLLRDGTVAIIANNAYLELNNKLNVRNLKNEKPSIKLNDKYKDKIEIEKGKKDTNFLDFVTATDKEDGDISKDIKVDTSKLDINKEGDYTITYSVKDSEGATTTLDAKIKVIKVNEKPSIKLKDKYKDKIEIEKGKKDTNFLDFVTATDKEDGDISKNIKVDKSKLDTNKEGDYTITYSVKDSEGATTTLDAKIKVIKVNEKPSIKLKDKYKDKIEIEKGKKDTNFLDFVTATDKEDGDISKNIKVDKSKLDTNKEGDYTITYSVKDSEGATTTLDAKVKVIKSNKQIGEAPSINANDKVIRVGSNFYPFREITANDKEDGNLTGFIKLKYNELDTNKEGDYKLIYTVTDKDNNTTEKSINVKVKDFGEKPVITAFDVTLEKGQAFNQMENISATDKEDGDISKNIKVVSNNVNVNIPGNYLVEYSVQDSDGNISKCTRNVIVKEIDGLPIINAQNLKVAKGSELDLFKNISAKDQNGNDISSSIKIEKMNLNLNEKGVYNVIYSVNDKDGNIGTRSVSIKVVEAPKIIAEDLIIPVNSKSEEKAPRFMSFMAMNNISYAEEKEDKFMADSSNGFNPLNYATAKDSEDGDISDELEVISTNVDPNKAGTYNVRYAVTNSNNLKSEKDIKVKVIDPYEKQDKDKVTNTDKDKK
uniref:immunoglobulin-like domain-containing protein n=1 Tax=Paraclostridium sordellii TaxID=1505 RepID=UPI000E5091BE